MLSRRLHSACGLILFIFVLGHLLNHSAGIVSLQAMEASHAVLMAPWTNAVGGTVLAGALLVHAALALRVTYRRRSLRLPAWQWVQLLLGLSVPILAADHVVANGVARHVFGLQPNYTFVLLGLWVEEPWKGALQALLLGVAWAHGCLGLRVWLRLQRWYEPAARWLFAAALIIPTLALAGYVSVARDVFALAEIRGLSDMIGMAINHPGQPLRQFVWQAELAVWLGFSVLVVTVFTLRWARSWWDHRGGRVKVSYPGGASVSISRGATVLEASQSAGFAHAAVCGGKARCSTCRVHVSAGHEMLPPASTAEQRVLDRIGARPRIRLACQLRPSADIEITPLVAPSQSLQMMLAQPGQHREGQEREIVILFADLRGFTRLSEHKLPYDVVFLLNRYFAVMGAAIEEAGGQVDKFIGDGIMALFGVEHGADLGCQQAVQAARRMGQALAQLNHTLRDELPYPLRFGIGVHAGMAIVGEMGYAQASQLTAIGDAVNTASRLEAMTKEEDVQLIVSDTVAARAGIDLSGYPTRLVTPRGKAELLPIRLIRTVEDLPEILQ